MINFARQGFANPFLSAVGASFQPGVAGSVRCPYCGNAVTIAGSVGAGLNPLGVGSTGQQTGGFVPSPYGGYQTPGLGMTNPLALQFGTSVPPNVNPLAAQFTTTWPIPTHLANPALSRVGAYGIDPRIALGGIGQQFGGIDPNVGSVFAGSPIAGDPISSLLAQQALAQQQLPIRPLISSKQGIGTGQLTPGFSSGVNQWVDPYRAFIEAQLVSQMAANPLYQLTRGYAGVPETAGIGMPFTGQQFNPLLGNVPFFG